MNFASFLFLFTTVSNIYLYFIYFRFLNKLFKYCFSDLISCFRRCKIPFFSHVSFFLVEMGVIFGGALCCVCEVVGFFSFILLTSFAALFHSLFVKKWVLVGIASPIISEKNVRYSFVEFKEF